MQSDERNEQKKDCLDAAGACTQIENKSAKTLPKTEPTETTETAETTLETRADRADRSAASLEQATVLLPESLPESLPGSLQVQYVRCGKSSCHCAFGTGHGPYYYRFSRATDGRLRKVYVPRAEVEVVRIACHNRRQQQEQDRTRRQQSKTLHTSISAYLKTVMPQHLQSNDHSPHDPTGLSKNSPMDQIKETTGKEKEVNKEVHHEH